MGKKATKAADNVFCIARYQAAKENTIFNSRETAAESIGIDRTRLARIELGTVIPYPEEVLTLSKAYRMPELCNQYCARKCPIGRLTIQEVNITEFDRLILKVLGSTTNINDLRRSLIKIAADGIIDDSEKPEFHAVLESLERISENAQALKLWAMKYLDEYESE